jgi:hypothetical protein
MEIVMKGCSLEHFQEKDIYSWHEILEIIENMESELHNLQEEYDDFKQNVEDNYKPISYAEQVGISDRDFI